MSNIDQDQFEAVWSRLGPGDHVDAVTTGEGARSCKPHRGIYDLALRKAGAEAAPQCPPRALVRRSPAGAAG